MPTAQASSPGTVPTRLVALCVMAAHPESVPGTRRFVRAAARRWGVPEHVDEALALMVSELVTNAVLHSGSTDVEVVVESTGTVLTLRVHDHGRWPVQQPSPRAHEDGEACSGRGLHLVAACADRTWTSRTAAGTTAVAELDLPAPAATAAQPDLDLRAPAATAAQPELDLAVPAAPAPAPQHELGPAVPAASAEPAGIYCVPQSVLPG